MPAGPRLFTPRGALTALPGARLMTILAVLAANSSLTGCRYLHDKWSCWCHRHAPADCDAGCEEPCDVYAPGVMHGPYDPMPGHDPSGPPVLSYPPHADPLSARDVDGDDDAEGRLRLANGRARRAAARQNRDDLRFDNLLPEADHVGSTSGLLPNDAAQHHAAGSGGFPMPGRVLARPSEHPDLVDRESHRQLPLWPRSSATPAAPRHRASELQSPAAPGSSADDGLAPEHLSPVVEPPRLKAPGSR